MAAAKGRRPPNAGKGRKPGIPNKTTKAARDAFELAFGTCGGVKALGEWAKNNQTEFYKLYARLIPVQHQGDPANPIAHVHRVLQWGDQEIPL